MMMIMDPRGITLLGPKRSRSEPIPIATPEWTSMNNEKTPAVAARLQPNSFRMATKKTEKEYQTPKEMARLIMETPTIFQP